MSRILIFGGVFLIIVFIVRNMNKIKDFINPVVGKITSPFGERVNPDTKQKSFHNGVDIAIKEGSDVKAPFDSIVRKIFTNERGGLQIFLSHPKKGIATGYAHLLKSFVKEGEKIKQGFIFALSGKDKNDISGHLHLTLTNSEGKKINPESIFTFKT